MQIASTTDSQEQVNAAAGVTVDQGEEIQPVKSEAPDQEATKEGEADAPDSESQEKPKKGDGGFQRRIDKLTKKLREAEAEREELRERIARAAETKSDKQTATDSDDPEPKIDQFDTYEAFVKAQAKWEARQEYRAQRAKDAEEAESDRKRAQFDKYNKAVAELATQHEDFEDLLENAHSVMIPQSAQVAIIEDDNGAQVLYHLLSHPEEAEKLNGLSDAQVMTRIGRISARFDKQEDGSPERKPAASTAGKPIKPVTSAAAKSTKPLDELPLSEYMKVRNQQERERANRR